MSRARVVIGWVLLLGSTVGFAATFPLWLAGLVSDRALLGLTLALSWLALMFEAFTTLQVAHDNRRDETEG